MMRHILPLSILLAMLLINAHGQGNFKPRDADEEHAWRLYNQYSETKKKDDELRKGIAQVSGDIKTVNVGSVPGLGIDPGDVARLQQLRQQLIANGELEQKLEQAWDKKFWGRYGDLKDSASSIYDPKTKTTMDKIRFRLIYFPFNVVDGTYVGTIMGASGRLTLVVKGSSVTGTAAGTYNYKFGDTDYSDPFSGRIEGTLTDGRLVGSISGSIGGSPFTGSLSGSIANGVASGTWSGKALTTAVGTFTARKK